MPARPDVQEWEFLIDDLVSTRLGNFQIYFLCSSNISCNKHIGKCYLFFSSTPLLFKIKDNQKTLFSPYYPIITVFYKAGHNGCMVASQDDQPNIFQLSQICYLAHQIIMLFSCNNNPHPPKKGIPNSKQYNIFATTTKICTICSRQQHSVHS